MEGSGLGVAGWKRDPNHPTWERHELLGQTGPCCFLRLLEFVDLEHAFRRLRLAIERLRGDGDFNRFFVGLPVIGSQGSFQGGVAHVDTPFAGAGLTGTVRHVSSDTVVESRLILLGHGQIGPSDELNREAAIHFGERCAVSNLLAGAVRRPPPEAPVPPGGIADFAHDAPAQLGPIDGCARVGRRLADQGDLVIEPRGCLGGFECGLEFGPFVLLHADGGCTGAAVPSVWMVICPMSRSRGAVKLPLNEP